MTRWNNHEIKTKRKKKPPYWRIVQLIRKLRLRYKERDRGEPTFHITVDQFGIVFMFSKYQPDNAYIGWDVIRVDLDEYELNPLEFGRDLMWLLISKGYMAYLRGPEGDNVRTFKHFIIDEGWGIRIMEKRLELYGNLPKHKFMIDLNKRMRQMPIHYILTYYPNFFDYLW